MSLMMTRRTTLLGAAALVALPRLAFAAPAIGGPAPDFALPDQDGTLRRLADLRGKVVVLEWTNHDCPYVRKFYGSGTMQGLQREAAQKGIVWLSVASSAPGEQGHVTAEQARQLTQSRQASPAAVLLDPEGKVGRAYEAKTTPHIFVIGADGMLRYMGGIDSLRTTKTEDIARAEPYARNAFLAVAEGRPVQQAVTQPYGCTVKYVDKPA